MKTDFEIAHEAKLELIERIAEKANIPVKELEPYGKYIAKVPYRLIDDEKVKKSKLILVTAITPTKAGIGKTTVSVGLALGMNRIGKNAIPALREPSLGPCFGMKGGAAGGGYAQVLPMEKINLHFTGDFHAITSANNMIAALNRIYLENGELDVTLLGQGFTWLDTGTHESLVEATNFVKTIETHQHRKIACLEEIAYTNGWISKEEVMAAYEIYKKNQYGQYLKDVIDGKYIDKLPGHADK